jgi:hypothetical protein
MNHGAGLAQATDNTRLHAEVMIEKYAGAKGLEVFRTEMGQAVQQFELF